MEVRYGETDNKLVVQVVKGKGPNFMSRNWLRELKVRIHLLKESNALKQILEKHSEC